MPPHFFIDMPLGPAMTVPSAMLVAAVAIASPVPVALIAMCVLPVMGAVSEVTVTSAAVAVPVAVMLFVPMPIMMAAVFVMTM